MLQFPNIGRSIVSMIVIVGFFLVVALLLVKPVTVAGDIGEILKVLLGLLGGKFSDVVQFHIGSSSGSKEKDDMVRSAISGQSTPIKQG